MYKKMVFPAAIREKSQRGVALSCDAHVVSAQSVGIRQPCTESLSETASCRTFLSVQHFCAGNSKWSKDYCPRNLFSGSNSSPEKSLQKNLSIFCLENQSCDRRYVRRSFPFFDQSKAFSSTLPEFSTVCTAWYSEQDVMVLIESAG